MRRVVLFGVAAVSLLLAHARAEALIANCSLKANSDVKTMPSAGDEHFSWKVPKELAVAVSDQHGGQWVYITNTEFPAVGGWVLRSSLQKCENSRPWGSGVPPHPHHSP